MHRSGTSMLSAILHKLGVYMGTSFYSNNKGNLIGHYENNDFFQLNQWILHSAGGSWKSPPSKQAILNQKAKIQSSIIQLIKNSEKELWGWKDPRTCLTIKLYLPFLKNPHFLLIRRNNTDIAKSLEKRDGISLKRGKNLTKIYDERILAFFSEYPQLKKLELEYSNIVNYPIKNILRIIKFLDFKPKKEDLIDALNVIISTKDKKLYEWRKILFNPWKIPLFVFKSFKQLINQFK